jgi:hypothetical protein
MDYSINSMLDVNMIALVELLTFYCCDHVTVDVRARAYCMSHAYYAAARMHASV